MAVNYIDPNPPPRAPGAQETVYKDNALPIEYALAHRKLAHGGNPAAFVFTAQNAQECQRIFEFLAGVKSNRLPPNVPLAQVPSSLVQQGYVTAQGAPPRETAQPAPAFVNAMQNVGNRPHIEILLDGAVLMVNENGMAYQNSKGDAIDQQVSQFLQQQFWGDFYDKPGNPQQKKQLAEQHSHFHKDVKQQTNDHDAVPWALANLDLFSRQLDADGATVRGLNVMSRNQLAADLHGQPYPRQRGANFNLRYLDERENEQAWRNRRAQLREASRQHGIFHQHAVNAKTAARDAGQLHAFRQDPRNAYVEVLVQTPPEYVEDDNDLNKFKTKHENGAVNSFELKAGNIVATSAQGEMTYTQRFEKLANDFGAVLMDGGVPYPIIINSVKPPSKEAECIAAFEKVHGRGNVRMAGPPAPGHHAGPGAVHGRVPRH